MTQRDLFGFEDMRPKAKVPISEERIREAQKLLENRDGKGAAAILRDIRYKLEAYEKGFLISQKIPLKPSNVRIN